MNQDTGARVMHTRVKRNWYKVMNARLVSRARMKRRKYRQVKNRNDELVARNVEATGATIRGY